MIHRDISEHPDRDILNGNYFRLNVLQRISTIGLDEWNKLKTIIALIEHRTIREPKRKITNLLRYPYRASRFFYRLIL